jgi:hypothetical protein
VRLTGRGHELVRATHAKTLEFTPDTEITARATCVLAVGVDARPAAPLAGPVRITITVGSESFTLHARANPSWDPRGPMVVRRSPLRLPGTLATHADAAASDLPRPLIAALRAGEPVEVLVEPEPSNEPTVVLFAADPDRPDDAALRAELDAADTVLAEDPEAVRRIGRHDARPGPRTLVVATRDLPGRTVVAELAEAAIETVGLPARLAVAAASPSRGPVTFVPDDADARAVLRSVPIAHRLVLSTSPDRLPALVALAKEHRGTAGGVLAQEHLSPTRIRDGVVAELPSQDTVHVCLDARAGESALDPAVRAAIAGLVADGVPTKTAARALAELTGWPRRRAYEFLLDGPG